MFDAMTSLEGFISVAQAAEILKITPRAMRYRIERGDVQAKKLGAGATSAYVIDVAQLAHVQGEGEPCTN